LLHPSIHYHPVCGLEAIHRRLHNADKFSLYAPSLGWPTRSRRPRMIFTFCLHPSGKSLQNF
jgi:hypothetical protein